MNLYMYMYIIYTYMYNVHVLYMYNAYSVVYVYIHVHVQSCTVQCIQYMYIVYIFVGCCLATRGVRGLLWAKGWVWLTESWPERLLGNSQQHYLKVAGYRAAIVRS